MLANLDPEFWRRLKPLFEEAVGMGEAERREYVQRVCVGDERLGERLAAMLAAHEGTDSLLDRSVPERLCEMALGGAAEAEGEDLVGIKLRRRFEVERELGAGGFGRVYLARDVRLQGRRVAVKVLHKSPSSRELFERELAALARLHHPGIATPRDSGETPGGRPFLVLDYVAGPTLREVLKEGPIERTRTWRLVRQLGAALAAAHRSGVWHLDLKPANVLLMRAGEADECLVVVDFGISRISGFSRLARGGSLAYAAPEQVDGAACAASDQYGLALVALGMMTGYRPEPLRGHGEALEEAERKYPGSGKVLKRALEARPEDRFATVGEMAAGLEKVLAPAAGRRTAAWVVAAAAVLFAAGFAWWMKEQEHRILAADVALLEQQMSALASVGRTTSTPPRQTYEAVSQILENLQARVDSGYRDPELLRAMSNVLTELGMMRGHPARRGLGRSEEGAALLRRALGLAETLRTNEPGKAEWVGFSVEKHNALASVLVEMGQYEEAEAVAKRGLAVAETWDHGVPGGARFDPWILGWRIGLTMTLSRVPFHARRWEECLALRDQAIEWKRLAVSWLEKQPGYSKEQMAGPHGDLAGLLATRGYLLRDMGRWADALRDYGESDALVGELLKGDPQNQDERWLRARNALEAGRTYLAMGRKAEAKKKLEFALDEMRSLSAGPAMDVQAMRSLSMTLSFLAVGRGGGEGLLREARERNAEAQRWDPDNAKIRDEAALIEANAVAAGVRIH